MRRGFNGDEPRRLVPWEAAPERVLLNAEWQSGPTCSWTWQRDTRVSGLELDTDPTGELLELEVGRESQLMGFGIGGGVSLVAIAQFWPRGALTESPASGWKIGRVQLPAQREGIRLLVVTSGYRGRLRPFGVQLK